MWSSQKWWKWRMLNKTYHFVKNFPIQFKKKIKKSNWNIMQQNIKQKWLIFSKTNDTVEKIILILKVLNCSCPACTFVTHQLSLYKCFLIVIDIENWSSGSSNLSLMRILACSITRLTANQFNFCFFCQQSWCTRKLRFSVDMHLL